MVEPLKSCPFCGGQHITDRHVRDGRQMFCGQCGASVAPTFHGPNNDTIERAITAWNTRASQQAVPNSVVEALEGLAINLIGLFKSHCDNIEEHLEPEDQANFDHWEAETFRLLTTLQSAPAAPAGDVVERDALAIIEARGVTDQNTIASMLPVAKRDAAAALTAAKQDSDAELQGVWQQARENHAAYSATGDREQDIRFFGLGLAGEAGEVANFIKKRWRDGDAHEADLRAECADVFAYNIMLADALGMTASELIAEVARKQQVFIAKMQARDTRLSGDPA